VSPSAARCEPAHSPLGATPGIVSARALLEAIARGEPLPPGEVAVVLCAGAGLASARALRARGLDVTLICRSRDHVTGPCESARAAAAEGMVVESAAEPAEVIQRGGRARWLRLERGGPEHGFILPADLIVLDGPR
jgi:hypothetical protein